jgi:hypothetical protein
MENTHTVGGEVNQHIYYGKYYGDSYKKKNSTMILGWECGSSGRALV